MGENVEELNLNGVQLNNLTTLAIEGAYIEARAFSTVSAVAPKLKHLELLSCVVYNGIKLPNISLSELLISTTGALYGIEENICEKRLSKDDNLYIYFKHITRCARIDSMAFVRLFSHTADEQEQFFMLFNRKLPIKITKDEYTTFSKGRYIIDVECKSLSLLKIRVDPFTCTLNFHNGTLMNGYTGKKKGYWDIYRKLNDQEEQIKKGRQARRQEVLRFMNLPLDYET